MFAEEMCNELVSISASQESPALILQGTDKKGQPFLDVLIECELKQVNFYFRIILADFGDFFSLFLSLGHCQFSSANLHF